MHPLKDRWTLPRKSPVTSPSSSQPKVKTKALPHPPSAGIHTNTLSCLISVENLLCSARQTRQGHQPRNSFYGQHALIFSSSLFLQQLYVSHKLSDPPVRARTLLEQDYCTVFSNTNNPNENIESESLLRDYYRAFFIYAEIDHLKFSRPAFFRVSYINIHASSFSQHMCFFMCNFRTLKF